MRKILLQAIYVGLFLGYLSKGSASGLLFDVTTSGAALQLTTTIPNHTYAKAGIKINTPGFSIADQAETCDMVANGYCLFSVSDTQAKSMTVVGPTQPYSITLCLNGIGAISCQEYTKPNFVVYEPLHNVSSRLQWHQNFGYCGETSFIDAGLAFGQYVSQYSMRDIASEGGNQYNPNSQLLLGVNDVSTANKVFYKHESYTACTNHSHAFLTWIKTQLYHGYPVVIGIYLNEYLFYRNQAPQPPIACQYDPNHETCTAPLECAPTGIPDSTSSNGTCQYGDPEYDHIVTVVSVTTQHPCTGVDHCEYDDDDIIQIDDHGLYASECDYGNSALQCPSSSTQVHLCRMPTTLNYQYLYSYAFSQFQKTRAEANRPHGNLYSLSDIPVSGANCTGNYGIGIRGLKGVGLLPISVSVSRNYECDMVSDGSNSYYPVSGIGPVVHYPIVLTVTVSKMRKGQQYHLYQYDRFSKVPLSHFNQHADQASNQWVIESATGTATQLVYTTSNKTAIFRAVSIDAP